MRAKTRTEPLSDNAKLAIIFNEKPVHKEWIKGDLSFEDKRKVLDAMDIATDAPWILGAIEDLRDLRKGG